MSEAQETFWSEYYGNIVKQGNAWLDYSNERVQAQTFALALEGAGPIENRVCVDIGCGWGGLSRTLAVSRAASVTGVDLVPEMIEQHRVSDPHIQWRAGSLGDPALASMLGSYDLAFLLEVLQYVPLRPALHTMWEQLKPGGRIVAVVPNASCPIVARTRERFGNNYLPPTPGEIASALVDLPDLAHGAYRGLFFAEDQRLTPYQVTPWRTAGDFDGEPNRVQFVAIKANA